MNKVTNEMLIEELQKLDARAERMVENMEELLAYSRETNKLVAEWRQAGEKLEASLAHRHISRTDAAE